jgi:hypothetical protein
VDSGTHSLAGATAVEAPARRRSFLLIAGLGRRSVGGLLLFVLGCTTRNVSTSDAKNVISRHKPCLIIPVVMKTLCH